MRNHALQLIQVIIVTQNASNACTRLLFLVPVASAFARTSPIAAARVGSFRAPASRRPAVASARSTNRIGAFAWRVASSYERGILTREQPPLPPGALCVGRRSDKKPRRARLTSLLLYYYRGSQTKAVCDLKATHARHASESASAAPLCPPARPLPLPPG